MCDTFHENSIAVFVCYGWTSLEANLGEVEGQDFLQCVSGLPKLSSATPS
jgi:hypothetical protein